MNPFKIRSGVDPLELAVEMLGQPLSMDSLFDINRGEIRTFEWRIYDDMFVTNLILDYRVGSDVVGIDVKMEYQNPDHTMFGTFQKGSTRNKVLEFVKLVRKPWTEWTEDEILSDLAWIALYKEDTGISTDTMISRMVMESYRDPSNKWVKRYFQSPE